MDKPIAAVEFGSKKLKLIVGYELDGQVYVVYALTKPYGSLLENGEIIDPDRLVEAMKEIKNFTDPSAQIKFNIAEVVLSLPPYGLQIGTNQQFTTVVGEDSVISKIDIRNVHAALKNEALPYGSELIDIVPVYYELNQGRRFTNPPLGEASSTLRIGAMMHALPKAIPESFDRIVTNAGISIKRHMVAPYGASLLLASYPDVPASYILVDIGSNMTTISLVGEKRLYASTHFVWGGDRITERIIEVFNINEADAEKYKITYGIDNREMNFKAPVCKSSDGDGNEIKHYTDELNAIIKEELSILVKDLDAALVDLAKGYDPKIKELPMILIGGGSRLNGLVEFIQPKVPSEYVRVITPRNLGARDATFTNLLGLIIAMSKNPSVYDENHPRVGQVTRDE